MKWLYSVLAFIALGAAVYFIIQPGVVKQIGSWKITKQDLKYRTAVAKSYFSDATEEAALKQLEKSARYLKILEKNGVTVSEEDLDAEEKRIARDSRDPKQLEKIKNIFKDDKPAYRKNFVKPILVDRFIYYDFFLNNPQVQSGPHAKAMSLIKASEDKSLSFEEQAKNLGAQVNTFTLKKNKIEILDERIKKLQSVPKAQLIDKSPKPNEGVYRIIEHELKRSGGEARAAAFWRDRVLPFMQVGQVFPQPVSRDERLLVIHLKDKKANGDATFQVAIFNKLNFEEWLIEQERD